MEKENHVLLSDLVEGILFSVQAEGRAKRTYEYYRKLLAPFLQFAREQRWPEDADRITALHIRQFLTWVGTRTVSYIAGRGCQRIIYSLPSVAWPYYKVIRHLYNWAIEDHLITANPTSTIHFKAPAPAPVLAYSIDEIKAIIAVCEHAIKGAPRFLGIRNKALIMLFLDSCLRLKEMATLSLSDVNLTEQYVRVVGKGNKPDFCPCKLSHYGIDKTLFICNY